MLTYIRTYLGIEPIGGCADEEGLARAVELEPQPKLVTQVQLRALDGALCVGGLALEGKGKKGWMGLELFSNK